ncbi:MAG: hypothetical protein Q4B09_10900, partial [Lachnospiraceae bacterium]|nr:hypothetical protein [Lachnospiraceae bacterium]
FLLLIVAAVILPQRNPSKQNSMDHFYIVFLLLTTAYLTNEALFLRYIQLLLILTPVYFALNKELYTDNMVLQSGMLAESAVMLMFYGRLSTYYYL